VTALQRRARRRRNVAQGRGGWVPPSPGSRAVARDAPPPCSRRSAPLPHSCVLPGSQCTWLHGGSLSSRWHVSKATCGGAALVPVSRRLAACRFRAAARAPWAGVRVRRVRPASAPSGVRIPGGAPPCVALLAADRRAGDREDVALACAPPARALPVARHLPRRRARSAARWMGCGVRVLVQPSLVGNVGARGRRRRAAHWPCPPCRPPQTSLSPCSPPAGGPPTLRNGGARAHSRAGRVAGAARLPPALLWRTARRAPSHLAPAPMGGSSCRRPRSWRSTASQPSSSSSAAAAAVMREYGTCVPGAAQARVGRPPPRSRPRPLQRAVVLVSLCVVPQTGARAHWLRGAPWAANVARRRVRRPPPHARSTPADRDA
jgi:hypothetical protein